jgi:hypothetical protein
MAYRPFSLLIFFPPQVIGNTFQEFSSRHVAVCTRYGIYEPVEFLVIQSAHFDAIDYLHNALGSQPPIERGHLESIRQG